MKQKKLPTAEEFATEFDNMRLPRGVSYQKEFGEMMIEFAQMHVQEALKTNHKNMQLPIEDLEFTLNTYPIELIK